MTRSCVLGANARFPTEYKGKGNGLTSLARHTPCDAPVSRFNAQCAQAASSGRPVVTKLHAPFHFGCVGFETAVTCFFVFVYSSTVCGWVISYSAARCSPILIAAVVAMPWHRLVVRHCTCLLVPRRPAYCRPSPLWPGVRDDAVLCAWGQRLVSDQYDGKGNGLMRPAGHMPMVGTREAICNTPRQRPWQWEALKSHDLLLSRVPRVSVLVSLMCCCVPLHQAGRRDVVCHLVARG